MTALAGPVVLTAVLAVTLDLGAADPVVSNVRAAQRPGTQLVDITYNLADPDSATLIVSVAVSDTGGATYAVPASGFTGDIGNAVAPGANKKITWDAGKDWPGKYSANMRFRVTAQDTNAPSGMAFIPAGPFQMGDTFKEGDSDELPVHTVDVSAFYMDKYEVTKALWDEVYQWGVGHGYSFESRGSWYRGNDLSKGTTHPVHTVFWYDCVKWCNARSEKEGRVPAYYTSSARTTVYRAGQVDVENDWVKWEAGYRLPTEAEWEKAARGGLSGKRFPWGDTISHSQANYYSDSSYSYDVSPTRGRHPDYDTGGMPYTSPVGSFGPNGYGLHDMTGNVWEWCWDWWGVYSSGNQSDSRGPPSGSYRVIRGGSWNNLYARNCRVTDRFLNWADYGNDYLGFRSVLPPGQ